MNQPAGSHPDSSNETSEGFEVNFPTINDDGPILENFDFDSFLQTDGADGAFDFNAFSEFEAEAGVGAASKEDEPRDDEWGYKKHMTISKDQTKASNFEKERLIALGGQTARAQNLSINTTFPGPLQPASQSDHRISGQIFNPVPLPNPHTEALQPGNKRTQPSPAATRSDSQSLSSVGNPIVVHSHSPQKKFYKVETNHSRIEQAPGAKANERLSTEVAGHSTFSELQMRIAALELENERLKTEGAHSATTAKPKDLPKWQTLYLISGMCYLEEPEWLFDAYQEPYLKARSPVRSINTYLEQHNELRFVLYRDYTGTVYPQNQDRETIETPVPTTSYIKFVSADIISALNILARNIPKFLEAFPSFFRDIHNRIDAPFLFMYFMFPLLPKYITTLDQPSQVIIKTLSQVIIRNYGRQYREATTAFQQGLVSGRLMPYLVRPGDVLVGRTASSLVAYIATSWCETLGTTRVTSDIEPIYDEEDSTDERELNDFADMEALEEIVARKIKSVRTSEEHATNAKEHTRQTWKVSGWSWRFDGSFEKRATDLNISLTYSSQDDLIKISSLDFYPIRYANDEIKETLTDRGKMFWHCRYRKLVSYQANDTELHNVYPIDQRELLGVSELVIV